MIQCFWTYSSGQKDDPDQSMPEEGSEPYQCLQQLPKTGPKSWNFYGNYSSSFLGFKFLKMSTILSRSLSLRTSGPSAHTLIKASKEPSVNLLRRGVQREFINEKVLSTQAVDVGIITDIYSRKYMLGNTFLIASLSSIWCNNSSVVLAWLFSL